MILVAQLAFLAALFQLLTPAPVDKKTGKAAGTQARGRCRTHPSSADPCNRISESHRSIPPLQPGTWLPDPQTARGEKLAYENFVLRYTPFWIGVFAVIVGCQLYESFTAVRVCVRASSATLSFSFP